MEEKTILKIKFKYDSIETFIQRFAPFVGPNSIFLPMKAPKEKGTLLGFEIYIGTGEKVFSGEGRVIEVHSPPQSKVPGIGLEILALDKNSYQLLQKILEYQYTVSDLVPQVPPKEIKIISELREEEYSKEKLDSSGVVPSASAEGEIKLSSSAGEEFPLPLFYGKESELPSGGPIIGVDLGTTNTCCAIVENGKPKIIPSRYGYNTIPSVIAVSEEKRLLIGHPAKSQMLLNPENTVYGAKRLVGRKFNSPIVQELRNRFHYKIVPTENGDAGVELAGRVLTLQEVSGLILREIKEIAQNYLNTPVSRAVISVPAYYSNGQRQAVRQAGLLAGLKVERIVNEPTAAALAYGFGRGLEQTLLVYDLGGGTFDASILQIQKDVYGVISTGGNTFLGGVDFDNRLMDYVIESFYREYEIDLFEDTVKMQRIKDAVEKVKCDLSTEEKVELFIPYIAIVDGKTIDIKMTITREQLELLVEDLVEETLKVCSEVLKAASMGPEDIDEVILVGGQTRMPLIHRRLEEFFGKPPHRNVHPDEAVAIGTAILAYSFGKKDQVRLIDVLAMSIGVGLPGGRFKPIIPRNTKLPFQKSYIISTTRDNQTEIDILIFQGESDRITENEYLGTLSIKNIRKAPRGENKFEIKFKLNNECLLTVSAKDLQTGEVHKVVLTTKDTPEDVKRKLQIKEEPKREKITSAVREHRGTLGWIRRLLSRRSKASKHH